MPNDAGLRFWPNAVQLSLTAVDKGLPDAETNVMLFLSDGTSCEGFLDYEPEGTVWRDVCADPLDDGVVVGWAPLPDRERPETIDTDSRLAGMRAALTDSCDLLEGWVLTKCPKRYVAEHMQHIAKLRQAGRS